MKTKKIVLVLSAVAFLFTFTAFSQKGKVKVVKNNGNTTVVKKGVDANGNKGVSVKRKEADGDVKKFKGVNQADGDKYRAAGVNKADGTKKRIFGTCKMYQGGLSATIPVRFFLPSRYRIQERANKLLLVVPV